VLFGGGPQQFGVPMPTDAMTWEWDGTRWTSHMPSGGPSPRVSPAMTFDPTRAEILLVGGADDRSTWTWNGARWATIEMAAAPTQFRDANLAYDQARQRTVLFGGLDDPGSNTYGGTWELTTSGWEEQLAVPATPPPRSAFGMTYVDAIEGVMVFGGYGGAGIRYDDLWSWDGATWRAWE
jgi:hypothetical protein